MLGARHPVHRTRQETIAAARSGLRVGFTCCSRCALLRAIQWNPSGHYFSNLCCRRRNCSGRPDSRVQSPSMGHHFLTHNVSKCSPFPFEIRYQAWKGFSCLSHTVKWSDFNASFASCIVPSFVSVHNTKSRRHLCSLVSLSCGKRPHIKLSCSLSATPMCILICASLGTKCDGPLVSCKPMLTPVTPRNFAAVAMVSILFALVLKKAHRQT